MEPRPVVLVMKPDATAFRQCLLRHNRHVVYHWTPACYLPSLLEHGVLCRRELDSRAIAYEPHGYGASGKEEDFAGHVCVSFHPQKGMMRTETGALAILVMPSEIVAAEGTFYCPQNSARSEYEFDEVSQWTSVEHLDALFTGPTDWWLQDWQAEVWIPTGVPPDWIRTVLFRNAAEMNAGLSACSAVADRLAHTVTFALGKKWHFPTPEAAIEGETTE